MANLSVILDISKTHLLSRMKQSLIAALGVTFGIGTFIILVSFMTGLNGMLDGLVLNRTPHIHIFNEIEPTEIQPIERLAEYKDGINVVHSIKPRETLLRVHNAQAIISNLRKDDRVKGVTPQTQAKVFYLAGTNELNGVINGIQVQEEVRLFNFSDYIIDGSPLDLLKMTNGILLGAGIAKKMSLKVGDKVQVTSPGGGVFPLKIVGLFQSGLAEVDNIQSYANLNTVQRIMGEGSNFISDINVKLWDMEQAVPMTAEIKRVFDVHAVDIKTANAQFETGTSIRNLITYAVSITLLIVAGFGIYNILNMLIYEKMNDIAILKATGFSGSDVRYIFIGQALTIGFFGGLLGVILGYGVSVLIDHTPFETEALPTIKTFPVVYNPTYYIIGVTFAMVSTFLAGFLPARKAEKIDPVEIIRGQ